MALYTAFVYGVVIFSMASCNSYYDKVEISKELIPEESPIKAEIQLKESSAKNTGGGAFHEKKEKNKKINQGGSYLRKAKKHKRPLKRGDKRTNLRNKGK